MISAGTTGIDEEMLDRALLALADERRPG